MTKGSWARVPPTARAGLVIVLLLVVSAALVPALEESTSVGHLHLPWWLLALMFALVEVVVLHAQVRRQAQTLSLCELPLVLGLFFVAPEDLILARVIGPFFVFLLHRRQPPVKLLFNTALLAANSMVAVVVFHAVHGPHLDTVHGTHLDPAWSAWLAMYAAVLAAGALDAVAITLVIGAFEGTLSWRQLLAEPAQEAPRAAGVATVALVAVYALALSPVAAVPLAVSAGFILVGFRAYAALNDRHLALERVYRFTQLVGSELEVEEILRGVLCEARELLGADVAEVVVPLAGASGPGLRVTLTASGCLERREVVDLDERRELWEAVTGRNGPLLLPRRSRSTEVRRLLAGLGCKDAVAAPLRVAPDRLGMVLIADRMGEVKTFEPADVRLLETIANHAAVALQNARLIGQLRHDALHDALTGLPNRVALQQGITEALADLSAGRSAGIAVLVMDLDRFKDVNDTLGHQYGDQLLREVASRLAGDSLGTLVARLGGDEFAAVVTSAPTAEVGLQAGRRLLQALEQPVDLDGIIVTVGGSVGVAWTSGDPSGASELLKHADLAMYAAKTAGDEVALYDTGMDTASPERLALIGELRAAIELGQLDVHVQPKARLDSGRVTGVEALVRWRHPVRGNVPPDEFIAVAERSGLIRPLTMHVLRQALAACAAWRRHGVEVNVAVNLSARSLLDLDLAHEIRSLLADHAVPPQLLTLEITEGSVMSDPERTLRLLVALRQMGVRLSVDDFGTGYSSLSYLKRLPVHEVKIDRSFVTDMVTNAEDASIVRSVVDLGANLSLEVVAEGVEDAESWAQLESIGCTYAQGYYLSRPLPIQDFLPWLRRHEIARLPTQRVAAARLTA